MAARAACSFFLVLPAAIIIGLLSPLCAAHRNILYSGERLNADEYLALGNYKLIMQQDCNFVLYDGGSPVWASGTYHRASNCYVTLQSDGNLVIYSGEDEALWASDSYKGGQDYYVLILQNDRNVVIYGGAIWATGSNAYGTGVVVHNDGGLAARRNQTSSPLGSVAVVVNNNGSGEELDLGRKIGMVTTKEVNN